MIDIYSLLQFVWVIRCTLNISCFSRASWAALAWSSQLSSPSAKVSSALSNQRPTASRGEGRLRSNSVLYSRSYNQQINRSRITLIIHICNSSIHIKARFFSEHDDAVTSDLFSQRIPGMSESSLLLAKLRRPLHRCQQRHNGPPLLVKGHHESLEHLKQWTLDFILHIINEMYYNNEMYNKNNVASIVKNHNITIN